MTKEEFGECLDKIRHDDMSGLEVIYGCYYKKMKLDALYLVRNKADSEDIASRVIMKIISFAKAHDKPNITNVSAYLNKMVRNVTWDMFNQRKNLVSLEKLGETSCSGYGDEADARMTVWAALKKLSAPEAKVAIMFYIYDIKITDIAEELHTPVGTVKWRLSEIRKKLALYCS